MDVGIDQWAERGGAFERRIKIETQFPKNTEIRPQAGGDHELINCNCAFDLISDSANVQRAIRSDLHGIDAERREHRHATRCHQILEMYAERSTLRQLIDCTAAKSAREISGPRCPKDLRSRRLRGKRTEVDHGTDGRVACTNNKSAMAGITSALSTKHVGHAVADEMRGLVFPESR